MEFAQSWLDAVQQWTAYFSYCAEQALRAPVCRPFWTWIAVALLSLGALAITLTAWKYFSYRRKLAAAAAAEAARAHVDHDAIAARRWDSEKAYGSDLGHEEIEKRIRDAVDERRSANPPFPTLK